MKILSPSLTIGCLLVAQIAMAAQHTVGGNTVIVGGKDNNFFISRSQGITISISPTRPWWCLWLCTTGTKNAEQLTAEAAFSGLQSDAAQNSCQNCGGLDVMGPTYWGFSVPRPYSRADYTVSGRIDGANFSFSGAVIY